MTLLCPNSRRMAGILLTAVLTASLASVSFGYPPFRQRQQEQEERQRQFEEENEERNEPPAQATQAESAVVGWLDRLEAITPQKAADFGSQNLTDFAAATDATEIWAAETTRFSSEVTGNQVLHVAGTLLDAKDRVDALLNRTLATRTGFAALDAAAQHEAIRRFLVTTTGLIDLSGRLRYLQFDLLDLAVDNVSDRPIARERLLDLLIAHRSTIGAMAMVGLLYDPAPDEAGNRPGPAPAQAPPRGRGRRAAAAAAAAAAQAGDEAAPPTPLATKRRVLQLIAASGDPAMVDDLADLARDPKTPPELIVEAIEAIRQIGLPQDLRPGQDPEVPKPAITARQFTICWPACGGGLAVGTSGAGR